MNKKSNPVDSSGKKSVRQLKSLLNKDQIPSVQTTNSGPSKNTRSSVVRPKSTAFPPQFTSDGTRILQYDDPLLVEHVYDILVHGDGAAVIELKMSEKEQKQFANNISSYHLKNKTNMVSIWNELHRQYGELDPKLFLSNGVDIIIQSLGNGYVQDSTFILSTGEDGRVQNKHSDYKSITKRQRRSLQEKKLFPSMSAFRTTNESHLFYAPKTQYNRTVRSVRSSRKLVYKSGQLVLMAGTLVHQGGGYTRRNPHMLMWKVIKTLIYNKYAKTKIIVK